jgi:hypothetical protein
MGARHSTALIAAVIAASAALTALAAWAILT